nr:MAG TPA: hypothetical protein [Caudoviricetes sp.]
MLALPVSIRDGSGYLFSFIPKPTNRGETAWPEHQMYITPVSSPYYL